MITSHIKQNLPTTLSSSSNVQQPTAFDTLSNLPNIQSSNTSYLNEVQTNNEPMHTGITDNNNKLHAPTPSLPDAINLPTNGQIPSSLPFDVPQQEIKISVLNSDLMSELSNTSFLRGLSNNSSIPTNGQMLPSATYDVPRQEISMSVLNSNLMRGLSNTTFLRGLSNSSSILSEALPDLVRSSPNQIDFNSTL